MEFNCYFFSGENMFRLTVKDQVSAIFNEIWPKSKSLINIHECAKTFFLRKLSKMNNLCIIVTFLLVLLTGVWICRNLCDIPVHTMVENAYQLCPWQHFSNSSIAFVPESQNSKSSSFLFIPDRFSENTIF